MALCMKCGTKLADGANFCAKCGTPSGAAAQGNASDDTAEFDSDYPWGDGTVVIEDDTNQGSGAAVAAAGIMLAPGMIIVLHGKNCTIEGVIEISGEAAVYKIKMDGKPFILKLYRPGMPLCDTTKAVLFGNYNGQDYEIMEFTEGEPSRNIGIARQPNQGGVQAWVSKGGKACKTPGDIALALEAESIYYKDDLKNPNASLYQYFRDVEGAQGAEISEVFFKYFETYAPDQALRLICSMLKGEE